MALKPLLSGLLTLITVWSITFFSHRELVAAGPQLLHSDFAATWLVSDDFRAGHWSAFLYQMTYAGIPWTVIRAAWMWIYESIFQGDYFRGQALFTYTLSPLLLAGAAWFLGFSYFRSWAIALVLGILSGVGLVFWIPQWGNDTYVAYLALGTLLLGLRANVENPWKEWSSGKLVFAALLSGLAFYTSRISAVFLLSVWIPWGMAPKIFRKFRTLHRGTSAERIFFWIAVFFFVLFLFLEIHGPEMTWGSEKKLKLHAQPNLKIALLIWGILLFRTEIRKIVLPIRRYALFALGFIIGFLPELLHRWTTGAPTGTQTTVRSLPDAWTVFLGIPKTLHAILSPNPWLAEPSPWTHDALAWIFVAGGLAWSVWAFYQRILPSRQHWALAASAALAVAAFCRIHNYAGPEPRYLIPIFPWLGWTLGSFLSETLLRGGLKKRITFGISTLLLLMGFAWTHHQSETTFAQKAIASRTFEKKQALIEAFKNENVRVVISQDYWLSNELNVFAKQKILFTPETMQHMTPPEAIQRARTENRVGAIFGLERALVVNTSVELGDRLWKVEKELGDIHLLNKQAVILRDFRERKQHP